MKDPQRLFLFEPYCDAIYGNQRYLRMLGAGLANEGFDVHVAVPRSGALTDWLDGEAITVHVLEEDARSGRSRGSTVTSAARAAFHLDRLIRRLVPDTVHANNLRSLLTVGPSARMRGLPSLWYVKGLDNVRAARIGTRLATRRIAMGRALLERIDGRSDGIDAERDLVPLGAPGIGKPRDRAAVRAELGIAMDRLVILLAASLNPNKGVHFAVEAMARLSGDARNALLLVAGGGARGEAESERYVNSLESIVTRHGLHDRVRFLGYRTDVPDLLAASDLSLLPSIKEAVGRSIVEAMQCGVPVVASRTGAVPETVVDGETGYLVPIGDVDAIAGRMQELLEDAELRASFGASARVRATRYSIEYNVSRMAAIHRQLHAER